MNKKRVRLMCVLFTLLFVMLGLATVSATGNQTSQTIQDSYDTDSYDTHIIKNDVSDNVVKPDNIQNTQKDNISTTDKTKTINKDTTSTKTINDKGADTNKIYVSTSGSGDGSKSSPTSFYSAMDLVEDNGTIYLTGNDENVYYLTYVMLNPNSFSNNVSNLYIVGEKNANITIDSYGSELFIIEGLNIHFKNINFVNGGNYMYYGSIVAAYSSIIFEDCNISDYHGQMKDCSYIKLYTSNVSLINCNIYDNDIRTSSSLIGNKLYRMMGYSINDKFIEYHTDPNNITVVNSTFKNNRLDASSNILFFDTFYNVTVINNTFTDNIGENGLIRSFMGQNEIYENNNFLNNNGTCLYLAYSRSDIKSNNFINNHAIKAPCLLLSETESNIENNLFKDNTAETYGGSIINFANSQNNITNCVFENNMAETGGAIYNLYNNVSIKNCSFINNRADEGGALCFGHQTFVDYTHDSNNTISNCLFSDNIANKGSVLYLGDAQVNLTNNAIIDSTLNRNLVQICDDSNYSIDNNWWSTNTPDFNVLTDGIIPNTWRIMTFTNTSTKVNNTINLKITINTLNNGKTTNDKLPSRKLILNSTDGSFSKNNINLNSQTSVTYTGSDNKPTATIDNQQLVLNNKKEAFINVNNIKTRNNQTVNIKITSNNDLTKNITVLVNNKIIKSSKTNGFLNIEYYIDDSMNTGNYTIKVEYPGDTSYYPRNATATLEVYNTKNSKYNNVITPLGQKNNTITTELPVKYDPRTLNLTTPLKDQGDSGSCWVFAAIGTLETNIKKSTNITYDFSENHAKNTISKYSIIGNRNQLPNIGGRADEIIPYLVGWYGPVEELDDPYVYYSTFSPNYNSSYHVQDVIFIPNRQNITDIEKIKQAIYNYGAVQVAYVSGGTATNIYNFENYMDDHAAAFVGWDDNYDRNNFAVTYDDKTFIPEGNGAFIIKNSWGGGFADDGYQYISYYDLTYGGYNDTGYLTIPMYTFMLNNTPTYNNIYQYDGISESKYFIEGEAWIKNIFTANKDETLAAIGTYIIDPSEYQLNVYINDVKVHTQEDTVNLTGYRTIQLTKYFQLYKDDEFTIELRIKSLTDNYTTVYYQDAYDYPEFNKKNVSFISYDKANTWMDMADYLHAAVALKAYTLETPQIETQSEIKDNILTITTKVQNNNENATISYKLNNKTLKDANNKEIKYEINKDTTIRANVNIENITGRDVLTTIYTSKEYVIQSENELPKETDITLNTIATTKIGETIKIQGTLKTKDNNTLSSENIIITINNKNIPVKTDNNGQYSYETTADTVGINKVTVTYKGNDKFYASNSTTTFRVKQVTMIKYASIANVKYGTTVKIVGRLLSNGTAVKYVPVTIKVNNKLYELKTDGAGYFRTNHTVNSYDVQKVTFKFAGNTKYASSTNSTSFKVKQPTWIKLASIANAKYGSTVSILGRLLYNGTNAVKYALVTVTVNNKTYQAKSDGSGYVRLNYTVDSYDVQKITFKYAGSNLYLASSKSTTFKVKQPTWIKIASMSNVKYGDTVKVVARLFYNKTNPLKYASVKVNINGNNYQVKTDGAGYVRLNYTVDSYVVQKISFKYAGSNLYLASSNSTSFKVKQPTIIKYASIAKVKVGKTVQIVGRLLYNGTNSVKYVPVNVKVNGNSYQLKTDGAGYFRLNYTTTTAGVNNITSSFTGNTLYLASANSTKFTVVKS